MKTLFRRGPARGDWDSVQVQVFVRVEANEHNWLEADGHFLDDIFLNPWVNVEH